MSSNEIEKTAEIAEVMAEEIEDNAKPLGAGAKRKEREQTAVDRLHRKAFSRHI